jgi:hypothetical protein
VHRGDDRDPGAELTQHAAERARVYRRSRHSVEASF